MGRLIWLASYPRSGNTWLRAFLHNYIAEPPDPYAIDRLGDLTTGESGAARYRAHDPRPASQYAIADVQRMRPLVHRAIMEEHPDLRFVKTHNASLLVGGVPTVTPAVTAGAVYLVRDPRDVAVSYSRHLGRPLDETIAFMADPEAATGGTDDKVYERLSSWSVHVHYWTATPHPRRLVLRYEDLVAAPEAGFGRLIRFLGAPGTPERLRRAIAFSRFEVLRAQEQAGGFRERPPASTDAFFRAGRVGAWREVLSAAQSARIVSDHGAVMRRFDYPA